MELYCWELSHRLGTAVLLVWHPFDNHLSLNSLLGITTLQAWLYYSRYDKDPTILKLTVWHAVLVLLTNDDNHIGLQVAAVWYEDAFIFRRWRFTTFRDDRIIEFIRSSFGVHASYHYAILEWGNLSALLTVVWCVARVIDVTILIRSFFIRSIDVRTSVYQSCSSTDPCTQAIVFMTVQAFKFYRWQV